MSLRRPLRHCHKRIHAGFKIHVSLISDDVAVVGGAGSEGEDGRRVHGAGGAVRKDERGCGVEGGGKFGGGGEGGDGDGFGDIGGVGDGLVMAV